MTRLLADRYNVRGRFQRSTRIDRGDDPHSELDGFILHETGRQIISRLLNSAGQNGQRAFTWTGPYGSGKSTLALYLAHLLGVDKKQKKIAKSVFGLKQLPEVLQPFCKTTGRWLVVRVTGSREDSLKAIWQALQSAIGEYWDRNTPSSVKNLREPTNYDELVDQLLAVGKAAAKANRGVGLFLMADEMGRLLENAAQSGGSLHLFQEIAERFSRSTAPCIFLGILHQSFQEYAGQIDRDRRNEWAKIQGRFEDTPFNVSINEALSLLGRAIKGDPPEQVSRQIAKEVASTVHSPRFGDEKSFVAAVENCYPLHPLSALLLPSIARQKFGQNERSLFSFLASGEPGGFREYLTATEDTETAPTYLPDRLWDYLDLNLQQVILASPVGHRWSEALEAVERATRGTELHLRLTKIIALLDLFGRPFTLHATQNLLLSTFEKQSRKKVKLALGELAEWSVIAFRQHLNAWVITSGSDIDIDDAIEKAWAEIGKDVEVILPLIPEQRPVVAKRHYHEKGTLRWYRVHVLPIDTEVAVDASKLASGCDGAFVLSLSGVSPDNSVPSILKVDESSSFTRPILVGLGKNTQGILDACFELAALKRVNDRLVELQTDRVARREIQARISLSQNVITRLVSDAINSATWFLDGAEFGEEPGAPLTRLASELSDRVYSQAPPIKNELINRIRPSSNAVAARRLLMHSMVNKPDQPSLGIKKYPPEKGLYLSLLKEAGLHHQNKTDEGSFRFIEAQGGEVPSEYVDLWRAADEFVERTASGKSPKPFDELYDIWSKPPFGLKAGVIPVLALTYFMSRSDELSLYIEGLFEPRLNDFVVDRLLQDPAEVAVRLVSLKGVQRDVLKAISHFSNQRLGGNETKTALDAARALVMFAHRLHPWVKKTDLITPETKKIRAVLLRANDPNALLFEDLPHACGFNNGLSSDDIPKFLERMEFAHEELKARYEELIDEFRNEIAVSFGLPDASQESLDLLRERAASVAKRTGDNWLEAVILRLSGELEKPNQVESLAGLIAKKPPRDWTDRDITKTKIELQLIAQKFDRIERFLSSRSRQNGSTNVSLFVSQGANNIEQFNGAVKLSKADVAKIKNGVSAIEETLDSVGLGKKGQTMALIRLLERRLDKTEPDRDEAKREEVV